jgi:DNA-binding LacI/PurR family transcriptional regulator
MRKKAPTVYEIAARADVSVSTVSRVINGRATVNPAMRGRVQRAMLELRFRPNRLAQTLYRRRSNLLGCVLPDITNPYFARLFLELETQAFERGYTVFLGNTASRPELEHTYLHTLSEQQVDGIFLLGGRANTCGVGPERLGDLRELIERLPIVAVNGDLPGDVVVSSVRSDEAGGARLLTRHLRGQGHTRVAFLGGQGDVTSTVEKLRVYQESFPDAPAHWTHLTGLTPQAGGQALAALLAACDAASSDLPTAALCVSDLVALGVLAAARARGLRVPEDLSITGFDDIFAAEMAFPRLTTVTHNDAEVARQAIDQLVLAIEGGTPARQVWVPTTLIERNSVMRLV